MTIRKSRLSLKGSEATTGEESASVSFAVTHRSQESSAEAQVQRASSIMEALNASGTGNGGKTDAERISSVDDDKVLAMDSSVNTLNPESSTCGANNDVKAEEIVIPSPSIRASAMEPISEDASVEISAQPPKPAMIHRPLPVETDLMSPVIRFKSPAGTVELRRSYLDDGLDDEALPPIPGARRLGNRRASRMAQQSAAAELPIHPSKKNSIVAANFAQMSPGLRYRVLAPQSPAGSKLRNQRFALDSPSGSTPAQPHEWNAEAFRLKSREAHMALQLIPKYTAALREANRSDIEGLDKKFDAIMGESISAHLDVEYEEAAMEIIRDRLKARAFLGWKIAATSLKKNRDKQAAQQLRRPPSFSTKLELLSSQGQRVPSRVISRGGSFLNASNNEKGLARSRVDSSVTVTDVGGSMDDVSRPPSESLVSTADEAAMVIKKLYEDAAKLEESSRVKSQRKSNRLVKMVNVLTRIASSKSIRTGNIT